MFTATDKPPSPGPKTPDQTRSPELKAARTARGVLIGTNNGGSFRALNDFNYNFGQFLTSHPLQRRFLLQTSVILRYVSYLLLTKFRPWTTLNQAFFPC